MNDACSLFVFHTDKADVYRLAVMLDQEPTLFEMRATSRVMV